MLAPDQDRAKAAHDTAPAQATDAPAGRREFEARERTLATLADNERWLADNHAKTFHAGELTAEPAAVSEELVADEERILRCLGAALIMRWNTLPQELQRELFDDAGSMGELSNTAALRAQVARFLHRHKDDEAAVCTSQ